MPACSVLSCRYEGVDTASTSDCLPRQEVDQGTELNNLELKVNAEARKTLDHLPLQMVVSKIRDRVGACCLSACSINGVSLDEGYVWWG